ncbi:MAG: ParA family protein [Fusobacteria bacterium]|nr:ParA family protein [Fusobacteriota bacterium]
MGIISIVNQKGGVGKTTTAVNVSSFLALQNKKVLLIDLDPQGNATTGLGIDKMGLDNSVYNVLIEDINIENVIIKNLYNNLDVLPAKIDLAGAEIELVGKMSREKKLKKSLDKIKSNYDVIIIDCPPSLGLLTINALSSSDSVIIPIQCEFYALEGLSQLLNTINIVKSELNPELEIGGIILTMFDQRIKLSEEVVKEVKNYFKDKVFETIIPRNVRLSESPSYGKPISEYDQKSKGALAYENVAKEVIKYGLA